MQDFDSIIIGAGPAGLSASIYLARSGLNTLLIGDLHKSPWANATVENYFGVSSATGEEISLTGLEQAKSFGLEHIEDEVTSATQKDYQFTIITATQKEFTTKTIIIATGLGRKKSGIKGEDEFKGKGIHECVMCDGFFYKDKKVAILGHSNHAAQEAVLMSSFTNNITIIAPQEPSFTPELKEKIKEFEIIQEKPKSFQGEGKLTGIELESGVKEFDGVFVALGNTGAGSFVTKLGLQANKETGAIIVDQVNATSIKGVFAAGNCTGGNMQATKSAGDGCNAAIETIKLIKGLEKYSDY